MSCIAVLVAHKIIIIIISIIIIVIIIIIIIMLVLIIIVIIIIVTTIHPSKISTIQGLRKHATCCLGILSVFIITMNRFVSFSVGIGIENP